MPSLPQASRNSILRLRWRSSRQCPQSPLDVDLRQEARFGDNLSDLVQITNRQSSLVCHQAALESVTQAADREAFQFKTLDYALRTQEGRGPIRNPYNFFPVALLLQVAKLRRDQEPEDWTRRCWPPRWSSIRRAFTCWRRPACPNGGVVPRCELNRAAVRQVFILLRRMYPLVVVDLGPRPRDDQVEAMRQSNLVGLVVRADVPGLRGPTGPWRR